MRRANPETPLYAAAIQTANLAGYSAWRENSGRRSGVSFGFKGKPDVAGFHRGTGRAMFWECKHESTTRRLTEEQCWFLRKAHDAGCFVRVFTDKGIYTLDEVPAKLLPRGAK